jgi:hypothetical protein
MRNKLLLLIFISIHLNFIAQESNSTNCYNIKYLDFFELENAEIVKWPSSEIDGLLKENYEKDRSDSDVKTNFLIPLIVYQLPEYHPNCKKEIDTNYFEKISKLYFRIRDTDSTKISNKSITDKIDFIRNDFYSQVENPEYLPKMIMTFDDGPFYGKDTINSTLHNSIKQKTNYGSLDISKLDNKVLLTSRDQNGKLIWQKIITGLTDRNLTDLHFVENPLEYTSISTIAHMYSEGERFTLFMKNDGKFLFYFHSW